MRKINRGWVLSMIKVREILRLSEQGLNQSEISRACNASRGSVQDYIRRAGVAGLSYSEAEKLSDTELLERLAKKKPGRGEKSVELDPDFERLERELSRKGVTLLLLWQEWSREHPEHYYGYATFCRRLNRWRRHNRITLRQAHYPGEKLFVDYAGVKVSVVTKETGEIRALPVFVAVLGASYYKYTEVTETAEMSHWLASHIRAFEFFGGLPKTVVIDNLKTGVTASCRYDPVLNKSYREFAEHYGISVLPARVRKPRDKALVEKAVQDVERSVLAPLRDTVFYSVAEVNQKISALLSILNQRKMRDYGESSESRFKRVEKALLQPLPKFPFTYSNWKLARVNLDAHVAVGKRYYSVPYDLVGAEVWVKENEKTITILYNNQQVALHLKEPKCFHSHTTDKAHLSPKHVAIVTRTAEYFRKWSKEIGPETEKQVERILQSQPREEYGYRTIQGIKRLAEKGKEQLEEACRLANQHSALGYRAVAHRLALRIPKQEVSEPKLEHSNLRGSKYYH